VALPVGTNGAAVVINPRTGEILAMVGSANYWNDAINGKFNVATGLRQPGGLHWRIYDEVAANLPRRGLAPTKKIKPIQADTIEELAKKAGIDPKGLKATIDKYNKEISDHTDLFSSCLQI
jgi:cell division protein FtsI/penicillin-binding protein 2